MQRPAAMKRSLGLATLALSLATLVASPALAQQFLVGDGCDTLPVCEASGGCPGADDHPVLLPGRGCFCAPGAVGDTAPPPLCCPPGGGSTVCPTGLTCTAFTDASGGLCLGPDTTYCNTATAVSLTTARACHTTPGGVFTFAWGAGDCDEDGVPNALEVADPLREPCVADDAANCLEHSLGDPAECCAISSEPAACCGTAGADPVICCASSPSFSSCCDAAVESGAGGTLLECCLADPSTEPGSCCARTDGLTGALCCEALGGPVDLCCEAGIFCRPDAGVPPTPDANVAGEDAGSSTGEDAGTEPTMDAGPTPLPPDTVGFGGGGGCRCGVGARAPSAPWMLGLALAIAIPVARRRRNR